MRIAVGVITRRRPQQFTALLSRLSEQDTPEGAGLHFIFVENDSEISVRRSVDSFTRSNVYLELEPDIGISIARNHVLGIANRIKADWLIWIDDDDLPTTNDWICRLYDGCRRQHLNAGYGVNIYPGNRKPSRHRLLHQGSNVIFDMAFIRENELRYNLDLPVGEDVQFGLACIAKGAKASVIEDAVAEIGGQDRFNDAGFRFRRARDEGMIKYGFHYRHLHVSNFHPVKTPVGITVKVFTAILNLLLAVLFVPGTKVRAARHARLVVGAVRGSCTRRGYLRPSKTPS